MFKLISLVIKTTQTKFANVMAKKLKVWLNNKLNKRLHCTVVIKFYHVFVTELVFTFFDFKYQKHFEFPKGGKRSPTLKILEIPGGGGVIKDPLERKILGGGGANRRVFHGWMGVWIFSGTTQWHLRNKHRNSMPMTPHFPDLSIVLLFGRGKFLANQLHYPDLGSVILSVWNSAIVSQISFYEEASGGVAKCWAVFSGYRLGALRENVLPAGRPSLKCTCRGDFHSFELYDALTMKVLNYRR